MVFFILSVFLVCCTSYIARNNEEASRATVEKQARDRGRVLSAIEAVSEKFAPVVLMRYSTFKELGAMMAHEEARD